MRITTTPPCWLGDPRQHDQNVQYLGLRFPRRVVLWRPKRTRCSGLVSPSAGLLCVEIDAKTKLSRSTQSIRAKCWISKCLVQRVGRCELARSIAVLLSSYNLVATRVSTPSCERTLRRYNVILPALEAATNSLSVELRATVGWYCARYVIGAPARKRPTPVIERCDLVSLAQSASTYPWREVL